MKILVINKYLYVRGGDASYAINTAKLLSLHGHKVTCWGMDHPRNFDYPNKESFVANVDFNNPGSIYNQIRMAVNILYSFEAKRKIERVVKNEKPDIVHLNSFAHQISPSILHVFKKYHIPVVMTVHDYKLVCPTYSMFLNGAPCERCKSGRFYNCFIKKCAKGSHLKSLLNSVEMYLHHKLLKIYNLVDIFIAPSMFLKSKVEEMGYQGRIVYLPYFIQNNEFIPRYQWEDKTVIYVGRLSREKGLPTLLDAMEGLDLRLRIVGEGPMKSGLLDKVKRMGLKNIEFAGYKTGNDLKDAISKSMFVIVPSEWYENYPFSIIESFALGKPVIGAAIGGIPELVKDGYSGLTFEPGDVDGLRAKIKNLADDPIKIAEMGKNARKFIENELNAENHYKKLIQIYNEAIKRNAQKNENINKK